ncbi:MAG: bifunctional [glutamate--ammonia ligase]-adenylyl-L-tyrosine phosphorylase/[glutamate--ammonia-ligase] adenylyltransferase [Polyangiaceae bacterium]|nr:bifunctional [glutamate--ammonia ligase]-adenylyl-L-tyrosine phosphorylase/[glutamate--ammonia-ligase] adenylyltransferase [Polyangiaceae bacterium]
MGESPARALVDLASALSPSTSRAALELALGKVSPEGAAVAACLAAAFPPVLSQVAARALTCEELAREGWRSARSLDDYLRLMFAEIDGKDVRAGQRRLLARERARLALRELLPPELGGAEVDVTAREVSWLAEAAIEVALAEAEDAMERRFGPPLLSSGGRSRLVVLGMGKLGGGELNVGSDIDLLYVYDSDDAAPGAETGLHEWWSRAASRLTSTLEEITEDGPAYRVDLRLRPEGSRGAIVNSVAACVRYYEGWGRPWERAALVRARPVAGDRELGWALLDELAPFVYRRRVDPSIARELAHMVRRSRAELSAHPERDLKLGAGCIREAEFFVQALQLIWGGHEPSVRAPGTLDALARLHSRGLVSDRETREIADSYLLLRRVEHHVQWWTGLQTHELPAAIADRAHLSMTLGFESLSDFDAVLSEARARVSARFSSLAPDADAPPSPQAELARHICDRDEDELARRLDDLGVGAGATELARDLVALARRPDDPFGAATAERYPSFGAALATAVLDAPDPELAGRAMRALFSRISSPAVYVGTLAEDPRGARRLATVLGGSTLIGDAILQEPELRDRLLLERKPPTSQGAVAEIHEEVGPVDPGDPEELVGALRRVKRRVTVDVALAELADEIPERTASRVLADVADAVLGVTTALAAGSYPAQPRGLAVLAAGRLGGHELSYASDLDVFFVFDPDLAPPGADPAEHFARLAQRIIRWTSSPHEAGPGYELDTRLRPSGSQGMLVTSQASFARYHAPPDEGGGPRAAAWERLALVRARFVAGDPDLGARVEALIARAAYLGAPPDPHETHRLRTRMEREIGLERPGRYNLKVGRGGVVDIEFATQLAQLRAGADPRVRTTVTRDALDRLGEAGLITPATRAAFVEGHEFLRRLERRIQLIHRSPSALLDEHAPGLRPLARRMGLRDRQGRSAADELVGAYRRVTEAVRAAYLEVLGVSE